MDEANKQSIRDQLTGVCTHYTGSIDHVCRRGTNIRELVGGSDIGWALRVPCIIHDPPTTGYVAVCDNFKPTSTEDIEILVADIEEREEKVATFAKWFGPIRKTAERGKVYTDICPVCGKVIKYSFCPSNGHALVSCITDNCIKLME